MLRILRVFISVVVIIVFTISFASLVATADTAFESQQTSLSNQGSTQATMQAAAASTPQEVTALGPGKAVEREISGKAEDKYAIALKPGEYAGVTVEQRGSTTGCSTTTRQTTDTATGSSTTQRRTDC